MAEFMVHVACWHRTSDTEYQKVTCYGLLKVKQDWANFSESWRVYRDDDSLLEHDKTALFRTWQEGQLAAEMHMGDGYPRWGSPDDRFCWDTEVIYEDIPYWLENELGAAVADAVEIISRLQVECHDSTRGRLARRLAQLYRFWEGSRFGSFDSNNGALEPYFFVVDDTLKNETAAPFRVPFCAAVRHYGRLFLRGCLAPHVSDTDIDGMISDLLWRLFPTSPVSGYPSPTIVRAAARGELGNANALL